MKCFPHRGIGLGVGSVMLAASALVTPGQAQVQAQPTTEDAYLRGYVQAVVDQQPAWSAVNLQVREGIVIVDGAGLSGDQLTQLVQTLSKVRGVRDVKLAGDEQKGSSGQVAQWPSAESDLKTTSPQNQPGAYTDATGGNGRVNATMTQTVADRSWIVFPKDRLFDPLVADPRWPHFGASYTSYQGETLQAVATVSFGETLSMFRDDAPDWLGGQWEFVLQPGVFAIFDMDSDSADLVNADYFIGGGIAWRNGPWSMLLRYYHQSSHLGDEFILNNGITLAQRVNLSYESPQLLVAYEAADWLRVYAGGGVLINTDPSDLGIGMVQYGVEMRSPWRLFEEWATPIAALDVKHFEYHDWDGGLSVRTGLEFTDPLLGRSGSRLLFLIEYYTGRSPHGQFFNESIRYIGAGLHFYY